MKIWAKVGFIFLLFLVLAAIRFFETELFYDPLIRFYKSNYMNQEPPVFFEWNLIANTAFRYGLNTLFSLLILWVAFKNKKILQFSGLFYLVAFLLLTGVFVYLIFNMAPENYFTLFYVRRFLIQPLFILLLLPAFFYQRQQKK